MTEPHEPSVELREVPDESIVAAIELREIVIDEAARDAIDVHVATDTRVEKGGVLVGEVDDQSGRVTITAAVPAQRAISAAASLTFTHEAWAEVNEVLSRDYPDQRMVGWYHSHPHFGVFLSEYDTFIQSNFFAASWQVAYVVDPLLGQSGVFGWENGNIVRYGSWTVIAHGSAKSVAEPERGKHQAGGPPEAHPNAGGYTVVIAIGLIALLAGIVGGYLARGSGSTAASTPDNAGPQVVTPTASIGSNLSVSRSWSADAQGIEMAVAVTNKSTKGTTFGYVTNCAYPGMTTNDNDHPPADTTTPTGTAPRARAVGTTQPPRITTSGRVPNDRARAPAPPSCSFSVKGIPPNETRWFQFRTNHQAGPGLVNLMRQVPPPRFVPAPPPTRAPPSTIAPTSSNPAPASNQTDVTRTSAAP